MKKLYCFILALICCTEILSVKADSKTPWGNILLDISSDVFTIDRDGNSESSLLNSAIEALKDNSCIGDSVMIFAEGRVYVKTADLIEAQDDKFKNVRNCIGDGTAMNTAIASILVAEPSSKRILVISNGYDNLSNLSYKTLAKLLRYKGIRVDAIIPELKSLERRLPDDTLYHKTGKKTAVLKDLVRMTGGNLMTLKPETKGVDRMIKKFKEKCMLESRSDKSYRHELDPELTARVVASIKPRKLNVIEVDTACRFLYKGEVLDGLNGVLNAAEKDSSIHIGKTPIKDDTPLGLLPMLYYVGEGDLMYVCGFEFAGYEF